MRRLAFFLVVGGAALLLFGAASALADNGPHVATAGTVTDRCAGCHRLHTAQATMLLKEDPSALCYTCHGSSGTGAANDVVDGVGYTSTARTGSPGALRGGGFLYALINASAPTFAVSNEATHNTLTSGSIGVLSSGAPATSAHSVDESAQTAWGGGAFGSGAGMANVKLTCASCHDPHGNESYRILNDNPANLPTGLATTCNPATTTVGDSCTSQLPNPLGSATVRNTVTCTVEQNAGSTSKTTMCRSVIETLVSGTWTTTGAYPPCSYTSATGSYPTVGCRPDVQAIADSGAVGTQSYVTDDYWQNLADPGISRAGGSSSPYSTFLTNLSNWCAQCHTRYLATSGKTYNYDTGDAVYKYRHRSNSASRVYPAGSVDSGAGGTGQDISGNYKGSPSCLQCHVAHGANSATGTEGSTLENPGGGTAGLGVGSSPASADNRLLRIDQRGICEQCHSK